MNGFKKNKFSGQGSSPSSGLIGFVLGAFVALGVFIYSLYGFAAWNNPAAAPPYGNVPEPVNVGTTTQSKMSTFKLGTTSPSSKANFYVYNGSISVATTSNNVGLVAVDNLTGTAINAGGGYVTGVENPLNGSDAIPLSFADARYALAAQSYWSASGNNIYNANSGYVGIGTTIPNNLIQVNGLINFDPTDKNTLLGIQAGKNLVVGAQSNTFIGYQAGAVISTVTTAAQRNVAIGYASLYSLTSGSANMGIGTGALALDSSGNNNCSVGINANHDNTTGGGSVVIGTNAMYSNASGDNLVALGFTAGRFITDGSTPNTTTNNSVFVGANARSLADGDTNENVFGNAATGAGSNSVVLGNDSVTKTLLKGNVGIGTTAPNEKLDVNGAIEVRGSSAGYATTQSVGELDFYSGAMRLLSFGADGSTYGAINFYQATQNNSAIRTPMVINNLGSVGIGTTNPGYKLQIQGDGTAYTNVAADIKSTGAFGPSLRLESAGTSGRNYAIYSAGTGDPAGAGNFSIYDATANSDRIIIGPTGNVGIATSSSANYRLDVNGSGRFNGDLKVTGQITNSLGDVAEEFYTDQNYPAGTVLVMDDRGYKSAKACDKKYDPAVIGVISAQPGMIVGQVEGKYTAPVALVGVIKVRVNDSGGKIHQGDLLTTSAVTGEAMKAANPKVGTAIGKALENDTGKGWVMAIVNLK
ncbi:MAG TPA: hypothetical protein VMC41_01500 [Candidatus Nanoarchaeia archaeon]|nr:hypothetical protein [Candidatus Nanoarchaeia archaeon]